MARTPSAIPIYGTSVPSLWPVSLIAGLEGDGEALDVESRL